ncbi:hypothetical protein HanRHA438_Chr13g0615911 [Helianthus annuus]|uniref:Uncharacterized protein n=1 Tax=Helianthus annuus TaxID=4232 RepID=A0A251SYV1_HELAN|nr:23 kDa jasmonate-induced protein [Helianthus annuus]KAF5774857.1 hypothetical protein HanXRQr2_Chr13g0605481 [Helianthus annuus]KAJ0478104.1 hypothetical protein HanHA300_Chr13g0496461 [Helianthus annuus]KAJ0498986.1 hypothetical protein HanHA89_Chr13g0529111 [Helianthus annuus]KAJ0620435.1 hypothetical protein HanHA300_Chr00c0986g0829641 [Helianthus annuus]KAJ0665001.1 hypothetical protein HanLR1_Chr13g0499141 [Helianthus annuus]
MAATAVRVFGRPITQGTRTQRAQAAKNYQNADGKLDQVLQASIHSQKAAVGGATAATVSTTFGRVYNATGDPVTYVTAYDWQGNVVGQYPVNIQNGQWAIFEHVGTRGTNRKGSVAAVVFNIQDCSDSMIAWNNPWKTSTSGNNTAYCEMNDSGYFDDPTVWDAILEKLMSSGTESQASMEGYATKVSIDAGGNTPSYSAIFYLDV